ncbi:MAG: GWxTD domain-containing protein [Candidatus Aminicenantia bacterium]
MGGTLCLTQKKRVLIRFFRRIEYTNKHFKEGIPGWKTDMLRVYIYPGEPDKEEYHFANNPGLRGYVI